MAKVWQPGDYIPVEYVNDLEKKAEINSGLSEEQGDCSDDDED